LAINEANGLKKNMPAHLVTEKEEYVYRSYLALGQVGHWARLRIVHRRHTVAMPLSRTRTVSHHPQRNQGRRHHPHLYVAACLPLLFITTPPALTSHAPPPPFPALKAIKLLATVMADAGRKDAALAQVAEWLADPVASASPSLQLVAAILYVHDDNLKEAIKAVHKGANMEQHALLTQVSPLLAPPEALDVCFAAPLSTTRRAVSSLIVCNLCALF